MISRYLADMSKYRICAILQPVLRVKIYVLKKLRLCLSCKRHPMTQKCLHFKSKVKLHRCYLKDTDDDDDDDNMMKTTRLVTMG